MIFHLKEVAKNMIFKIEIMLVLYNFVSFQNLCKANYKSCPIQWGRSHVKINFSSWYMYFEDVHHAGNTENRTTQNIKHSVLQ